MRSVGAAAAAITFRELGSFVAHGDADSAAGHVHMLDRAGSVSRSRAQDGGRRDLIAHKVDAATRGRRSQSFPTGGVFTGAGLLVLAGVGAIVVRARREPPTPDA